MFSTSPMSTKCDRALLLCEHGIWPKLFTALIRVIFQINTHFTERDVGTALSYSDKNHFEASISRKTYFKSSIWKYMATAPFSKTPRSCAVLFSWRHDGQDHRDKQTTKFTTVKCRIFCFVFSETAGRHNWSGADPGFLLGGGALVCCSTSTPINHIVFFWQNTSCIRKPQVISGGDAHPLHPPPRSAPAGEVIVIWGLGFCALA